MTQKELDSCLDRQVNAIHGATRETVIARARIRDCRAVLAETAEDSDGGLFTLGIAIMLVVLVLTDAVVAAPALHDRFRAIGLSMEVAWIAAGALSLLLMLLETSAAIGWFHAYERSLTTRRYYALVAWTVLSICIVSVPVTLQLSQSLAISGVTDAEASGFGAGEGDTPRLVKELGLVALFACAHIFFVVSGRYLEAAKTSAANWAHRSYTQIRLRSAERVQERGHSRVLSEYLGHRRSVVRSRQQQLNAEIGPLEDAAVALIRERHSSVGQDLVDYGGVWGSRRRDPDMPPEPLPCTAE